MSVVVRRFHDRTGNQLMQYLSARGYAESIGAELQTDPWFGERVFGLDHKAIKHDLPKRADMDIDQWRGDSDIEITGWCLCQKTLLYTRAQAKAWLKLTDEMLTLLLDVPQYDIACHLRWGDFKPMPDFIAVSIGSYERAVASYFGRDATYKIICDWEPHRNAQLEALGLGWLPDFYALMRAKNHFRANSTFSFAAALLGDNERVFSPQLQGVPPIAGAFQDVTFEEGNHAAISVVHPNCSTLYLQP